MVLDNFEQLVAHAALLERLLAGCPGLKLVVTSRVRLALAAEWPMPLEGLPCPDPEDDDRAEAFDAVRLFIKAATRIEPSFDAGAERAASVDICRQVEGLPLAIELAAAWVRVLPCREIAAELRHGTELLRATEASHPPRHASFDQVFEQSWQRLAPAERQVLARLAVFQSGFTVEAARAVARASLPVLGALADKSLLRRDGERMRLHPLVQQAAAARLDESGDRPATEDAHAAFFQALLVRLRPAMEDGDRAALDVLDAECDNAARAWLHGFVQRDASALRRVARTLLNYCDHRGRFEEGLQMLRHSIDSPLAQEDDALRALLVAMAAHLDYRLDRYAPAEAAANQALALALRTGDAAARLQALTVLASCALRLSRLDDAKRHYQATLDLAESDDEPYRRAAALDNLALVEKRLGHYGEALALSTQSLLLHRRVGDGAGVALCLNNLGSLLIVMQDYEAARRHLDEGLALCDRDGLVNTRVLLRTNFAELAMHCSQLDASEAHAARALEAAQALGHRMMIAHLGLHRARLALRRADFEGARTKLAEATEQVLALGVPSLQLRAVLVFAELAEAQGEASVARRVLAFGADHPSATAMEADELRTAWLRRAASVPADPPWPGLALDDLLRRLVFEAPSGHAALIEILR
jgi:predicted ATPase